MSVRLRRGKLQVPCVTFSNGKRSVVLYGVSHIAERSFWEETNTRIAELERAGYEVHFEAVKSDMDPEPMPALPYDRIAELLKLQGQKAGLDYSKAWTRTDITTSQLYAGSCLEDIREMGETFEKGMALFGDYAKNRMVVKVLRRLLLLGPAFTGLIPRKSVGGIPVSIMLDQRNSVALNAALRAKGDVVAIWGSAHLPGISKGLKAHGFKHVSTTWATVMASKWPMSV